ncbi:hypothetical protein QAD02_005906 [Eretmocerus hayati]|uniref:Uncharacterized protein n=1 Tax=Eretmocerus hayati TaxID=131215 RepID=A0ACC2MZV7_9HYME|nr:hypothetical protein QAD02_005906 [Eretmocerus hayati]
MERYILYLTFLSVAFGYATPHYTFDAFEPDEFKLEQAQVIFRHGDRTPRKEEIYKTDPYQPIYQKIGYGELTHMGKIRMEKFGRHLRELFGNFIGENGTDKIFAYHSGSTRTENSLRMVLAGLIRPMYSVFSDIRRSDLPLTLHNDSTEFRFLTTGMKGKCSPQYLKMVEQHLNASIEESKRKEFYGIYIKSVARVTGAKPTPIAMVILYYNLFAVENMGFPRPDWCSRVDCSYLTTFAKLFAKSLTSNDWMKRITAGSLLQRFLDNIRRVDGDGKKLHLYSAHDFQLTALAQTLNFTNVPELPGYGSALIIEKLRGKVDGRIYVRMTMRTGEKIPRTLSLKLQGCELDCPIEVFSALVKPLFPFVDDWKCTSSNFGTPNAANFNVSKE